MVPGKTNKKLASLVAIGMVALCLAVPARSQDIKPTPQQLQMLQQLPASQRQALMDAYLNKQSGATTVQVTKSEPSTTANVDTVPLPTVANDQTVEPVRIGRDQTVVVTLQLRSSLSQDEIQAIMEDPVLSAMTGSRAYKLDGNGVLSLPGLVRIPLLGLTDDEARRRISAEPALDSFDVEVAVLPLLRTGITALEPFGYDLFERASQTFAPANDIPVPADYVLGPGDTIQVQFYGKENAVYEFEVTRDGVFNLPELGPINVAGLSFSEFRQNLMRRTEETLIGTHASISMGQLRSIRVLVLGDVNEPGSYVVGGLATMTQALVASGGISQIGSLRNIELKRHGKQVANLDLYDLLLNGNNANDARLQPDDVVFVPPVGETVTVAGAVMRPAIYELRGEKQVADAVRLAGGLVPKAYARGAKLERVGSDRGREVISVDLSTAEGRKMLVDNGDVLDVPEVLDEYDQAVSVQGQVQRPGMFPWVKGMRLTDLLPSARALKDGADLEYILVRRESRVDKTISTHSANLLRALAAPGSEEDLVLEAGDTVYVFGLDYGRQRIVEPLLRELERQSRPESGYRVATAVGAIRAPGEYPLEPGMRVSDLVRAAGNLAEGAYTSQAEITRYGVDASDKREAKNIEVNLGDAMAGDLHANILLEPHDQLQVKMVPQWRDPWSVTLEGEFTFPGTYPIKQGETLSSVLRRAGGLTDLAFPKGVIFLREATKEREKEQLESLARRMESDLASLSLQGAESGMGDAYSVGQGLLTQLRSTEPVGRVVIDLGSLANGGHLSKVADIELRDGDKILMPRQPQSVTVIGEVQYSTSHLYTPGMTRDDYISRSGGVTNKADKKRIYVVRADGEVVADNSSRWFGGHDNVEIGPGDAIVVPLDTDRVRPLTFWGGVTQILYQGALAVAAIKTFK